VTGIVGEWRSARRRALPYESNAHSYGFTAAKLAQSKTTMPTFSDWVSYRTEASEEIRERSINGRHFIYI
jgi:hypothetical protein